MTQQNIAIDKSLVLIDEIHEKLATLRFLKGSITDDHLTNLLVRRINDLEVDFNLIADELRERDWDSDLTIEPPYPCF